jgi:hypothetical protein
MKLLLLSVLIIFHASAGKEVQNLGEEGKKTLLGVDSDKDGVRDDVQIWIDKRYPSNSNPSTNSAMRQFAKYIQLELQFYSDKEQVTPVHQKKLETIFCLMWVNDEGSRLTKEIEGQMLNTRERIKAYVKVDSYFDGSNAPKSFRGLKWKEMNKFCEFEAI